MASSSINNRSAPSEGQKVDLGRNAPIKTESAGYVPDESLAAESYRSDGAFAANRNAQPDQESPNQAYSINTSSANTGSSNNSSRENQQTTSSSSHDTSSNTASNSASASAASGGNTNSGRNRDVDTAPSYVSDVYLQDNGARHGNKVTEVNSLDDDRLKDGTQLAFNSEPGSKNDPSRVAEKQFEREMNSSSDGTGPRQDRLTNETMYDRLDSNTSA